MKTNVDLNTCQKLGQCVFAAPAVFALDEAGELVFEATAPDELADEVSAAVDAWPAQAMTIVS